MKNLYCLDEHTKQPEASRLLQSCRRTDRISSRDIKLKAFNDRVKCFSPSAEVSSTSFDLLPFFILSRSTTLWKPQLDELNRQLVSYKYNSV